MSTITQARDSSILGRLGPLGPPGLAGLQLRREVSPTVQPVIRSFQRRKAVGNPVLNAHPLADPRNPTTSAPLRRITGDPAARLAARWPRLPDIGARIGLGAAGRLGTRQGGVPAPPQPLRSGVRELFSKQLAHGGSGSESRRIKDALTLAREKLRPQVRLTAGLSGLQVAMAPRWVPDTPGGRRELIRDVRARQVYGVMAQAFTVPEAVNDSLNAERLGPRGAAPYVPVGAAAGAGLADGTAPPPFDPTGLVIRAEATDTIPTAEPGAAPALPLLALAFVAWLIFR